MQDRMVLPGDEVAVAEEFEPGEGTYERGGHIFAAVPGVLYLDANERVVRVRAFNPVAELKVGDIVYGTIDEIRGLMATAAVTAIHGRDRQVSGETEGTIHISNVSAEYVEDLRDAFHLGDIVRAKVIQTKPSVQLTTSEGYLGVVKARCSQCRGPLEAKGEDLWCPRDERGERRKLAQDYDDLKLAVPAADLGGGVVSPRHAESGRGGGRPRGSRDRGRGGQGGRDRGGHGRGGGRGRGRDRDRGPPPR